MADHQFAGVRCSEIEELAAAFVLDALEPAETDTVRRHLAECPEPHPEMAELHSVVPALFAAAEPVAPPAGLKERILAAAAADTQRATDTQLAVDTQRPVDQRAVDVARPAGRPTPARDEQPSRWGSLFRRPVWAAVSLAAALAVVALGAWNVQLQGDLASLTAYRDGVVEVLDQSARPGAQLAVLKSGDGPGPSGLAAVAPDGRVALVMRDLVPTAGSQVYETWLIGGDGVPVPIGGFTVAANGTAAFVTTNTAVADGVTVALTLEDAPGATAPKLPIIAAGAAQAQAS